MNEDLKFNRFEDVQHLPLRVFNRVIMMNNILEDFGKETLKEYIDNFSKTERLQMYLMQNYIKNYGVKKAREEATKGLKLVDFSDEG